MELALLVILIDPGAGETFEPINQVYQYVSTYQCQAAEKLYAHYPDRVAVCLDGIDEDLSIDEIVALANAGKTIPVTKQVVQ